jgi:hypothetical protein
MSWRTQRDWGKANLACTSPTLDRRTLLILLGYERTQDLLARLRNYVGSDGLAHGAICSKLWRDRSVIVFARIIPRCLLTRTTSFLHRLSSVSVQHMSSCSDSHASIVLI